MEEAKGGL